MVSMVGAPNQMANEKWKMENGLFVKPYLLLTFNKRHSFGSGARIVAEAAQHC